MSTKLRFTFLILLSLFSALSITGCNKIMDEIQALKPGDPNLDPNWDWYSYPNKENNFQKYTLWSRTANTGGILNNDTVKHVNVPLPYFSFDGGPAATHFLESKDVHPDDGWVLLTRNFGEVDSPRQPFFMLYNKARGVIRLFFYYAGSQDYCFAKITMKSIKASTEAGSDATALFTFNKTDYSCIDNFHTTDTTKNIWNGMVTYSEIMPNSWSHADFVVGYDPVKRKDVALEFKFHLIQETDLSLNGKAMYNQITRTETVNKSPLDILLSTVSTVGSIAKKGKNIYDDINNHNTDPGLAAGVKEKYKSNSSSTKSSIKSNKNRILGAIAAVFAVGGAIKSLVDSCMPEQRSYIVAKWYDIDLSGSLTKTILWDHIILNIPGTSRSEKNYGPMNPIYDKPMGVFSLHSKPKIAWKKVDEYESSEIDEVIDKYACEMKTKYWKKSFGLVEPLDLEINEIPGYIVTDVKASFVWEDQNANRVINGSDGLNNFQSLTDLYNNRNCFTGDMVNINNAFLDNKYFYDSDYFLTGRGCNRKKTKLWTTSTSAIHKFTKPLIQIAVTVEPENPKLGQNPVVILKTYTPEYLDEVPDSSTSFMKVQQDNHFIFPGRIYRPFTVNIFPEEYGPNNPHRITFTIYNNNQNGTLELTGNPKIELNSGSIEKFTVYENNTAQSIPPGGSTTFDIEFFSEDNKTHFTNVSIPNNDPGSGLYKFVITGTTKHVTGLNALSPSDFKAVILSDLEVQLTWKDNSSVEKGFWIYRKMADETEFSRIAELGPNTTSYSDISMMYSGEKRFYWIKTYNDEGETYPIMAHVPLGLDAYWDTAVLDDINTYWQ